MWRTQDDRDIRGGRVPIIISPPMGGIVYAIHEEREREREREKGRERGEGGEGE